MSLTRRAPSTRPGLSFLRIISGSAIWPSPRSSSDKWKIWRCSCPNQLSTSLKFVGNTIRPRAKRNRAGARSGNIGRKHATAASDAAPGWFTTETGPALGAINGSGRGNDLIANDFVDAGGSTAIDLFLFFGFLLGFLALPKFGRVRIQAIGFASMAFGMLLLMFAVQLSDRSLQIPLVFASSRRPASGNQT